MRDVNFTSAEARSCSTGLMFSNNKASTGPFAAQHLLRLLSAHLRRSLLRSKVAILQTAIRWPPKKSGSLGEILLLKLVRPLARNFWQALRCNCTSCVGRDAACMLSFVNGMGQKVFNALRPLRYNNHN